MAWFSRHFSNTLKIPGCFFNVFCRIFVGVYLTKEASKFRLDKFPARLVTSLAVELLPGFRLHGDAARNGGATLGVFVFAAGFATRAFSRAAVGGLGH